MTKQEKYDLFTFISENAFRVDNPFQLKCNCKSIISIYKPFASEYVICPRCELKIKLIMLSGSPGYVMVGDGKDGPFRPVKVQGSKAKEVEDLTRDELDSILSSFKRGVK